MDNKEEDFKILTEKLTKETWPESIFSFTKTLLLMVFLIWLVYFSAASGKIFFIAQIIINVFIVLYLILMLYILFKWIIKTGRGKQ